MRKAFYLWIGCALVSVCPANSQAQTTINGNAMALKSTPFGGDGINMTLSANGILGTYITLPTAGPVTLNLNASGDTDDGTLPRMNIVVDDYSQGWDVTNGFGDHSTTFILPAGTHFVRTEFTNDVPTANRTLTVHSLEVTGATVSNSDSNANALSAADTYVANFRKGNATVSLPGASPGTPVQVDLVRHAFNFGGAIAVGTNTLNNNVNFQNYINSHFNMLVPANAGKWSSEEATNNVLTLGASDAILNYAAAHNMRARQHNMLWATQQPTFVNGLLGNAVDDPGTSDDAQAAAAKAGLRSEISQRIDYYVGDGPGGFTEQAPKYTEVDVYNESYHSGVLDSTGNPNDNYWDIYGPSGIADIYNEVNQAIAASGSNAKSYVNEYNVFQSGDDYALWYLRHIESIENGDGDPNNRTVGGIGMQYYVIPGHSAARMQRVLQNLSVTDLPLSLTEFGVQSSVIPDSAAAVQMLTESMRMMFGSAEATTFAIWGWASNLTGSLQSSSVLVDGTYLNPTNVGKAYEDLLGIADWDGNPNNGWDTSLTATVNPDGTIDFNGYYGDYTLLINGQLYNLTLVKGQTAYLVAVPEPSTLLLAALASPWFLSAAKRQLRKRRSY